MEKSGIYIIKNNIDNKIYIGQSMNVQRRLYDHKRCLTKGIHYNKFLQRAFDKYGKDAFEFRLLCECPKAELDEKEKYFIEKYDSMNPRLGYNLESGGNVGKEVSEKVKEAKRGNNNPMYGKKLPQYHIEALKLKNRANSKLLKEQDVAVIKQRLANEEPLKDIAEDYKVCVGTISKIASLSNWSWVEEHLNNKIKNRITSKSKERNELILKLEAEGYSRNAIARMANCTAKTVEMVIGHKSNYFKTSQEKQKRNSEIVADFEKGLSKQDIMNKYSISQSVYVSVTSEAYNKRKEKIKQEAIEIRKSGMTVKEISEKLELHRTTITEWTKHLKSR